MTPVDSPSLQRTPFGWFARGLRDAAGFPAFMLSATMLGIGGLAREVGYPVWAADLTTLLIWAGPAQVILFGGIASGAALSTIALAIGMSSMRFLPMTVSVLPLVRGGKPAMWKVLLAAHLVSMTTWVEGLRRLPNLPEEGRMNYFLGFGAMIIGSGTIATHAGYHLYALVPMPVAAGLLFITPIFFAASIVRGAAGAPDWIAIVLGIILSPPAFALLPSGLDFIAVGMIAGTVAWLVRRRQRAAAEGGA